MGARQHSIVRLAFPARKRGLFLLALILFVSLWQGANPVSEDRPVPGGENAYGPASGSGPGPGSGSSRVAASPSREPEGETPSLRVSVKETGAVGDGKADDTAAIQAAVDRVGKKGGGVVYFPDGVYRISDSIVVSRDRVELVGQSWNAELRMVRHPMRVIVIRESEHNAVRNLKLSLGVRNAVRHDHDMGIYVTAGARHFLIERIFGEGKGIMVRGSVREGTIRDNKIQNTLADGIHLTGGSSFLRVTGNELTNTGDDSIAIVSYGNDRTLTRHVIIEDNRIRGSRSRGIAFVGGYQADVRGNVIEGTSSSGILVVRDDNYRTYAPVLANIEGNSVTGAGTYGTPGGNTFGIEIAPGAAMVKVKGNVVKGAKTRGISVAADRTEIEGNRVSGSGDAGLQVSADGCAVKGNLIEKNGTYGFVSIGSDELLITGNRLADNNTRGEPNIDNFLLKDSDSSRIKGNISVETRPVMQIERAYELTGTCRDTVFEKNGSVGTLHGTVVECSPSG